MKNKLRNTSLKRNTILLTQRVSHQTKERRMRIMGVLKSCSRTSSSLQTDFSLVHDGVTSDLTSGPNMSTPSEAAPRGWGSGRSQSLKRAFYWLLFLPPYPGYDD